MADTTPERRLLDPDQIDDVAQAVLSLTRELWVLTDRVHTLEAVLEKHGIPARAEIEAFEPTKEMSAKRIEQSQRMVQCVLGAMGVGVSPGEQMAAKSLKDMENPT